MKNKIKINWMKDNKNTFQTSGQAVQKLFPHCKLLANSTQTTVACNYWIWDELKQVGKKKKVTLEVFPDKPKQVNGD